MDGHAGMKSNAACPSIVVTSLHTYPIKSCAGVDLTQARVTPLGLELDREFMVVDDEANFVSQRTVPELALVMPEIGAKSITLTAPGMEPMERTDATTVTATVHRRPVPGWPVSDDLDDWFTHFLPRYRGNRRFRLLRVCDTAVVWINERYRMAGASNQVGFADGNAMLLAAEPSLAHLNRQLDTPVPMNRFRPNIVVDGTRLAPYDEDYWRRVQIGPLDAFVVKASDRCSIPDTDQDTAAVGKSVRLALRTRRGVNAHDPSNRGVFFAQNLNHVYVPGVTISVGDGVRVLARSHEPNVVLDSAGSPSGVSRRTWTPGVAPTLRPAPTTPRGHAA
jgi:uncharacterized protein YcbX